MAAVNTAYPVNVTAARQDEIVRSRSIGLFPASPRRFLSLLLRWMLIERGVVATIGMTRKGNGQALGKGCAFCPQTSTISDIEKEQIAAPQNKR